MSRSDFSYCDYATAIVTTPGARVLVAVGLSQYYGGYAASAVPAEGALSSLPDTAATDLAFAT